MILKPAWKHLNQTLPIYTETIGYGQSEQDSGDESDKGEEVENWDSDDVDPGEMAGLEGMIY